MAVSNESPKETYECNGLTDEFEFSFECLDVDHIEVFTVSRGSLAETPIDPTDYNVELNDGGLGGKVVLNSAPAADLDIYIFSNAEQTQETSFKNVTSFPEKDVENGFDKAIILIKELSEKVSRSIKFARASEVTDVVFPEKAAGRSIRWNDAGTDLVNSTRDLESIADDAEEYRDDALASKEAAETAKHGAEDAQDGAENAQAEAEEALAEIEDILLQSTHSISPLQPAANLVGRSFDHLVYSSVFFVAEFSRVSGGVPTSMSTVLFSIHYIDGAWNVVNLLTGERDSQLTAHGVTISMGGDQMQGAAEAGDDVNVKLKANHFTIN